MVTMRLMSDEITILVFQKKITYILSLAAAFIVASAGSERFSFWLKVPFCFAGWRIFSNMKQPFGFLESVGLVLEDLLVAIEDPGCAA